MASDALRRLAARFSSTHIISGGDNGDIGDSLERSRFFCPRGARATGDTGDNPGAFVPNVPKSENALGTDKSLKSHGVPNVPNVPTKNDKGRAAARSAVEPEPPDEPDDWGLSRYTIAELARWYEEEGNRRRVGLELDQRALDRDLRKLLAERGVFPEFIWTEFERTMKVVFPVPSDKPLPSTDEVFELDPDNWTFNKEPSSSFTSSAPPNDESSASPDANESPTASASTASTAGSSKLFKIVGNADRDVVCEHCFQLGNVKKVTGFGIGEKSRPLHEVCAEEDDEKPPKAKKPKLGEPHIFGKAPRNAFGTLGGNARIYPVDLSNPDQVTVIAQRIQGEAGVPDIIINNAGSGEWKFLDDTSPKEIQEMMAVPYFAAAWVTRAFLPAMRTRNSGHIVNVSSVASRFVWPGATAYTAARWAIRGLTEALRADLYGSRIGVTLYESGAVETPYWAHNPGSLERIPKIGKMIPVLRPEDVGEAIVAGVRGNKRLIVIPFMMKVIYLQHALFPWAVQWLMTATGYRPKNR